MIHFNWVQMSIMTIGLLDKDIIMSTKEGKNDSKKPRKEKNE